MHLVPILAHCLLVSKAGQSLLSLPSSLPVLDFSFTRLIVEDMAREGRMNRSRITSLSSSETDLGHLDPLSFTINLSAFKSEIEIDGVRKEK